MFSLIIQQRSSDLREKINHKMLFPKTNNVKYQHLSMQTDIILFLNPEYIINYHHLASEKYLNLDDGSLTNSQQNN